MPFDHDERRLPGGRGTGERAINLPPAVLWLIGINVAVHLLRQLLGEQADQEIILQFGLVPAAYTTDSGRDLFSLIVAPITYQFLHGGWMHLGVNMLTLAAFGAPVERLLGVRRFVLFYLVCGVVAGFVHILVYPQFDRSGGGRLRLDQRRVRRRADADALRRQPHVAVAGRRHLDRPQRLLRHLRRNPRCRRRVGRVGGAYRGLPVRAREHTLLRAPDELTRL